MAHTSLQGEVTADDFRDGTVRRVARPVTALRSSAQNAPERHILLGHPVRQLAPDHGLCRDETSGYVGWVAPTDLTDWVQPTHRVCVRSTFLFDAPDFKSPNPVHISCGSLLSIVDIDGKYARTDTGTFAIADHLADATRAQPDLAATAETLLGTPYLWAGNSAFGIDCSGLVQLACQAAHIPCPGDSDQQLCTLGTPMAHNTPYQRNDLLFWKGHVALVYDTETLIHANAHHMAVALEPIRDAIARIAAHEFGEIIGHRRL